MDQPLPVMGLPISGLIRLAGGLTAALIIWYWSSQTLREVLLFGSAIFAVTRGRQHLAVWLHPPGLLFLATTVLTLVAWPLSVSPMLTGRDIVKMGGLMAGCLALPSVFRTHERLCSAFRFSASAITLVLAADLVRLVTHLGLQRIMAEGRFLLPYVLNHPNVASMMAVFAFWTFLFVGVSADLHLRTRVAAVLGALLNLVYLLVMTSRGPQIAFCASALISVLFLRGRGVRLITAVLCTVAALLAISHLDRINPRFLERDSMETFNARDVVWRQTLTLVRERPLLGHGYGKKVFEKVFYADGGPSGAPFHYPHPHQFWLKILFEHGGIGLLLHLSAWGVLAWMLLGAWRRENDTKRRRDLLHIITVLAALHVYGLGDYPDGIVQDLQFLCVPAALVLLYARSNVPAHTQRAGDGRAACASV